MCLENFLFFFFLIEKSKNPPRAPPWEHAENKMPAARPPHRVGVTGGNVLMLLAGRKTDTPPAVQKNPGLVRAACSGRSQQHPRPTCVPRPLVLSGTAGHVAELVPLLFTV